MKKALFSMKKITAALFPGRTLSPGGSRRNDANGICFR